MSLLKQIKIFFGVGIVAAAMHYGALVALVEAGGWTAVPATLVGYVAGGLVSYALNRAHTFDSDRPHREAGWRFAVVAAAGFGFTWALMSLFVAHLGAPYLPAQMATTAAVLLWSFAAHRLWTFGAPR